MTCVSPFKEVKVRKVSITSTDSSTCVRHLVRCQSTQFERSIFIGILLFALQLFLPKIVLFFLTIERSIQSEYCFCCGFVSQNYVHLIMEYCIFGYLNLETLGASGQSILHTFTLHASSLFLHFLKTFFLSLTFSSQFSVVIL